MLSFSFFRFSNQISHLHLLYLHCSTVIDDTMN